MRTPRWVQVRSIVSNNRTVTFRIFGNLELTRNTAATMGLMRNPWRYWSQDYECKERDDRLVFQIGDWILTLESRSASTRQYSSTTCQPQSLQSQRLQIATWALPVGLLRNVLFKYDRCWQPMNVGIEDLLFWWALKHTQRDDNGTMSTLNSVVGT